MYTTRDALFQDMPQILNILQKTLSSQWTTNFDIKKLQTKIPHYIVAFSGKNKIVGTLGYWITMDELHITDMGVLPRLQHHGLGRLLLTNIVQIAYRLGVQLITLEVRISNIKAQNLYKKYGFETIITKDNYYSDTREKALVMSTSNINTEEYISKVKSLESETIRIIN